MKIKFTEFNSPDGIRSAWLCYPETPFNENNKCSSLTVLLTGNTEGSVRAFLRETGYGELIDRELLTVAFPDPQEDSWITGPDGSPDEEFIFALSTAVLPSGGFTEGWRIMADVHYLWGRDSGASLVNALLARRETNGLAAAACLQGGLFPESIREQASGIPVPALIENGEAWQDYYISANQAEKAGENLWVCPYNPSQKVTALSGGSSLRALADLFWSEFIKKIRRTNTTPEGDADRRIDPDTCGLRFHTLDTCLGDNGGIPHSWLEYVPERVLADPAKKVPLVIFSHGMSDNPFKAADMIKIHEVGEREGFITVYPFSCDRYKWNLACDPSLPSDTEYYEHLIDHLCRKYPVDTERIYLSGFSNGAGMAMIYAMLHPRQIAAIFPVDSTFPYAAMGKFRPQRPTAYLTKILAPGEKPEGFRLPPAGDKEMNLAPLKKALASQKEGQVYLPTMYFYGTRESEYPISKGSNQELSYSFWKEFNRIAVAETRDELEPHIGVPGEEIRIFFPSKEHPKHQYTENIFFSEGDLRRDYYHFLLMHGKAHEVHPAERELGWAFVSRFRRLPDGSLIDRENP